MSGRIMKLVFNSIWWPKPSDCFNIEAHLILNNPVVDWSVMEQSVRRCQDA